MIKLKFHLPNPIEKAFFSKRVIIGHESEDIADIPLDGLLQPEHVILLEEGEGFWAINRVNDPFVTLNGRPFGKKLIHSGDVLAIDDIQISFEGELSVLQQPLASVEPLLESKMEEMPFEKMAKPLEHEVGELEDLNDSMGSRQCIPSSELDTEVQALLEQVESLEKENVKEVKRAIRPRVKEERLLDEPLHRLQGLDRSKSPTEAPRPPLERDQLSMASSSVSLEEQTLPKTTPFHTTLVPVGVMIILLICLALLAVYATFSDQTDEQEFLAAQDVSDAAMALTYAQLHHAKAKHQNWSDPEFIKSNLDKVLDPRFETLLDLDPQGYLKNSPYMLRIHTSPDLSQFLLVAQPAPNIWRWFSRQQSILLDSKSMELRLMPDLRAINRLIVNPEALGGTNSLEISALVSDANLLSLKRLAHKTGRLEFQPPKQLKVIRPGTEDLVENAPRYYRLAEPLVQALAQVDGETAEDKREEQLRIVREGLQSLAGLPDLVLYTSSDLETASRAAHALKQNFPEEKHLIGVLVFDEMTGSLRSSQLVEGSSQQPFSSASAISQQHPLFQALQAIAIQGHLSVGPLIEEMLQLLQEQSHASSAKFYPKMVLLLSRYQTIDEPKRNEARVAVANLYQDYVVNEHQLTRDEFRDYASQVGLETYLPEGTLAVIAAASEETPRIAASFDAYLKKIREAASLNTLNSALGAARQWLAWGSVPDLEEYKAYELQLRKQSLNRLEQMLLSSKSPLHSSVFQQRNKATLLEILDKAGVTDAQERDFYLDEFDLLVDRYDKREWRASTLHKNFLQE